MNKTRREWSVTYKCCKGKRDSLTAFYSSASAIFVIAISFYGAAYFVGSKYPDTETLDDGEISRNAEGEAEVRTVGPSNSTSQAIQKSKKLVINQDDSEDDEMLTGSLPTHTQRNLSDHWNKLHIILVYLLYILFNVIVESK